MVQEVTTTSWGRRILNSFFGILIGILLIIGSFILIFWNEGHGLHVSQSLQQTQDVVITIPATPIDANNNQKVIHFSGLATTENVLSDPIFGLSQKALQLHRQVEMYQWKENVETKTETSMGGTETTTKTYSYEPIWSVSLISSNNFKDKVGHDNPTSMPVSSKTSYAPKVTVGDFDIPSDLVKKMSGEIPVDLSNVNLGPLKERFKKPTQPYGDGLYVGDDPQTPKIGDLKITMYEILPQNISVIGQQTGKTIQPYIPRAGQPVMLLGMGDQSSEQLIHTAKMENQQLMWILRFVSFLLMVFGILLILNPLVVLADVVPLFGRIMSFGTGLVAFLLGLILWSVATAIAWFAVRPLGALGLVAVVIALCYFIFIHRKRKQATTSEIEIKK